MAEGKVTKADIIDAIYQKKGIARKDIKTVVDSFLDEIKSSLIANQII
ncbi:MAG: HU family DNA-binding protein, partial [Treponema sp.]|nr:HU family DNA-binding protein [Treponema sp.]